jgi:phage FluMu protein Com
MTASRPHLSKSGPQLNELFEANKHDPKILREILRELKHRTTPSALSLRKKVEMALNGGGTSQSSERAAPGETDAPVSPPPRQPSQQTIQCRSCQTSLRVPVSSSMVVYSCPTCKAEFETNFKDGVLQVIWAETIQPDSGSEPMTETDARELLGVSASADFQTIKAAWRKASQQYHPDKHQGLPERLRRAAEVEMKRINEAYRLLERTTASDF